jgi:3-oxoacyl-[acyl-carrier protein] reductase
MWSLSTPRLIFSGKFLDSSPAIAFKIGITLMSGILDNQTAVVTGAGRGIGKAIAVKFASAGAQVFCLSRTLQNSQAVADEIVSLGGKAVAMAVDVADPESVKEVSESILNQSPSIDILVNNAGITRDGLLMRMSDADWDIVLQTNLRGAFLWTRALTRQFMKQRRGSIINLASVVGISGNAGQANYAASKAGLIGLTKSTAKELASRNIRANAIAPGFIHTDMTNALDEKIIESVKTQIPLGRFGTPDNIADAALFLASPASQYITGQVLTVDGGMTI